MHSLTKRIILRRLKSPNRRNMGYILRRFTPLNRRSIFSPITKFSNFEFLLFSVFFMSVMSDNRHRIWCIMSGGFELIDIISL